MQGGRDVERFRGGLVFEAHRLAYHSTLGLTVMKKKRRLRVDGEHHAKRASIHKNQHPAVLVEG